MNKSLWKISLFANKWRSSNERSPSPDPTNGSTLLGVSAENLEAVEVCFGDCPARNRSRLAQEALQTLLVALIPAQESRPTSDQHRYPKTCENDGRRQSGLGRPKNSWGTAQAGNRNFRTYGFPTDAEAEHSSIPDFANLPGQSRPRSGVDRLLHDTYSQIARLVCVHCFVTRATPCDSF